MRKDRLNHAQARKITGQTIGYKGLIGVRTEVAGAYYFFSDIVGGRLVIDDRSLDDAARDVFRTHLNPFMGAYIVARDTGEPTGHIASPKDRCRGITLAQREEIRHLRIWMLLHDEWCLALLHAGIRPGSLSDQAALKCYDGLYATSAHDRLMARRLLTRDAGKDSRPQP